MRIRRMETGSSGDVAPVGKGVDEMRVHDGPGCRVSFVLQGTEIAALLCGDDKSSRDRDIAKARDMAKEL